MAPLSTTSLEKRIVEYVPKRPKCITILASADHI